jgi:hypothetical protein
VEKPKKLLKMELKNAIEENLNLNKDVFSDESISFVIDGALMDRLLPPGQLKKFNPRRTAKAWRGKKSLLDNPPLLWLKENIATWMNDIGNSLQRVYELENNQIVLGAYIDAHGENVASMRRIWTHEHAGAMYSGWLKHSMQARHNTTGPKFPQQSNMVESPCSLRSDHHQMEQEQDDQGHNPAEVIYYVHDPSQLALCPKSLLHLQFIYTHNMRLCRCCFQHYFQLEK